MSSQVAAALPRDSTERPALVIRLVELLVITAMIASWCAAVIVAQTTDVVPPEGFVEPRGKLFIYYICHALGMASILSAGALAAFTGKFKRVGTGNLIFFWVMVVTVVTWALISYKLEDYLSWAALGATGPVVWLSCVALFAGMERAIWRRLEQVIRLLSYLTALLALVSIVTNYSYLTIRWYSAPVQYMILLMWLGGWTFLTSWEEGGWQRYLRFFPFAVFVLATVATQTRSWFLMSIFVCFMRIWINRTAGTGSGFTPKLAAIIGIFLSLGLILALLFQDSLLDAYGRFAMRALDDSRTDQYRAFFSQKSFEDLILGGGPTATWNYGWGEEYENYQNFDNAYLWMAFLYGVPLMLSYTVIIILPGFRAAFSGAKRNDAAAAALLMLWGLACTGFSTYINPSLTPYSYFLCLLSGRCLAFLSEHKELKEQGSDR
jgi:hypothetical protein